MVKIIGVQAKYSNSKQNFDAGQKTKIAGDVTQGIVFKSLTMPVNKGLDQFTAIQLVVVISVMHFEVMKLQLLL